MELTPLQAWQELKKVQRFFDVLNSSAEMLEVLAKYDQIKQELEKESARLKKTLDEKASELEGLCKQADYAKAAVDEIKKKGKEEQEQIKKDADVLRQRISVQLEDMKASARAQVEGSRLELAKLQPEVNALRIEKSKLESGLENLKKQALSRAGDLVDAFKIIGK